MNVYFHFYVPNLNKIVLLCTLKGCLTVCIKELYKNQTVRVLVIYKSLDSIESVSPR